MVDTLHQRVARVLLHVGGAQIERQLVLHELGRVAQREVVAVIDVVGDDAARVDRSGREIGLVALRTGGDAQRVGHVEARLEEVLRVVAARRGQLLAPAHRGSVERRAVGVLEAGHDEGRREGRVVGEVDANAALAALLRGDEDDAVGTLRTVERGGRGARQHRHRLDVLGVEVGDTLVVAAVGRLVDTLGLGRAEARKGNTVDHVEGVVVAVDRLHAAHHHTRRTARTRRAGVDLQTGDLTRKRVDEVGVLHRIDDVARDLLHVVGQRLLLTLDTECGDHDGVEHLVVLLHDDLQRRPARNRNRHLAVADERHLEHVARLGLRQREVAFEIDGRTGRGAGDDDRGADQGLALIVLDGACDTPPHGFRGGFRARLREDDVVVLERVGQARTGEQTVEHRREGLLRGRERHRLRGVDIGRVVDERIVGLLLNRLEDLGDGGIAHIHAHARCGRLSGGMRAETSHQQNRGDQQAAEPCPQRLRTPACGKVEFFHGIRFRLK